MHQVSKSEVMRKPWNWQTAWSNFLELHGDWWECRTAQCAYVYYLPTPVITSLAGCRTRRSQSPFFNRAEAQAEHAFNQLCDWRPEMIGVAKSGEPIRYGYLVDDLVEWRPDSRQSETLGSDHSFARAIDYRQAVTQSQMVHIAWLIQQDDYWMQLHGLKSQFDTLPITVDFEAIDGKGVPLATLYKESQERRIRTSELSKFINDLVQFASRWCLSGFATWDLPLPRHPLLEMPLEIQLQHRLETERDPGLPAFLPGSRLFGNQRTVWQLPYPDPRETRPARYRAEDRELGIKAVHKCNRLLKLYLTDVAIHDRFGGEMPRGMVGRMLIGLAEVLRLDADRVKTMRSSYLRAMRGSL
jgi:hypothetical protein